MRSQYNLFCLFVIPFIQQYTFYNLIFEFVTFFDYQIGYVYNIISVLKEAFVLNLFFFFWGFELEN